MVKLDFALMKNTPNMIFFLILFQVIVREVFASDENSAYIITQENKQLAGHVVERLQSPRLISCSHSCLRNSWCTSTNFKKSVKENEKGTCELNKHETAPINGDTELIDQPGVTFSMFLKVGTILPIYTSVFKGKMIESLPYSESTGTTGGTQRVKFLIRLSLRWSEGVGEFKIWSLHRVVLFS